MGRAGPHVHDILHDGHDGAGCGQALGIERHRVQGVAAGEQEMSGRDVYRHAGALQHRAALTGGERDRFDG